jgi:hypothetical protein
MSLVSSPAVLPTLPTPRRMASAVSLIVLAVVLTTIMFIALR